METHKQAHVVERPHKADALVETYQEVGVEGEEDLEEVRIGPFFPGVKS